VLTEVRSGLSVVPFDDHAGSICIHAWSPQVISGRGSVQMLEYAVRHGGQKRLLYLGNIDRCPSWERPNSGYCPSHPAPLSFGRMPRKNPAAGTRAPKTTRRKAPPKAAAAPEGGEVTGVVKALEEITAGLQYAHQSFHEAMLHLPRAEDYEPLATPLREFARTSPALADLLREVVTAAGPLAGLVGPLTAAARGLQDAVASVEGTGRQLTAALEAARAPKEEEGGGAARGQLTSHIEWALEAVEEALASLPSHSDYTPFARQLRELATVSPSLMEWLQEVPKVTTPLADAVDRLRDAAAELKAARALLKG
jgi:hypothetical protein